VPNQLLQQPPKQPNQLPQQLNQPDQFPQEFININNQIENKLKLLLQRCRIMYRTYFGYVRDINNNEYNNQALENNQKEIQKDKIISDDLKKKLYNLIDSYDL
ncbi:13567_t:CDS:2, partial [Gigaspora margarita]